MKRTRLMRALEILPGVLTWLTFTLPIVLAFYAPKVVSMVVMLYALYWFFKTVVMSKHLVLGYKHYKEAMKTHWLQEVKKHYPQEWERVIHVVFVPMYKEDYAILDATFEALDASDYPNNKIIPILCTEERAGEAAQETAKRLKDKFSPHFHSFYITVHPDGIPGEVKGKGPNLTYAAHQVMPKILKQFKAEDILVTTLDSDSRIDKHYLSCVTKAFLDTPDPENCSYQPLPMFFNNIWDVPLFARMSALGSSFWVMVQATRPDRLRNFSSHSQSLTGLLKSDYWSTTTIVEDGHQYWRSLYRLNGKHRVIPIFVPIYMDAVLSHSLWGTIKEQYLQKRRWAWGASDIPYVAQQNFRDTSMSTWEKWKQFFILFEGHYSWATTSIVLAFGGWPPLLINANYQQTVFAYNFPFFYSKILFVAGVGMVVTLVISTLILPPPPARYKSRKWLVIRDWILTPILLPVSNLFLGAMPAIDAQTRLMLGKYMEVFRVTVKKVVNHDPQIATVETAAVKSTIK